MNDSPKDYFKAVAFGVVCVIALGESLLLGSVVWHGAMDKSPITLSPDPIQIICKVKP